MKHVLLAIVLVVVPAVTFAQTEGRIGVGVSTTINATTDGNVGMGKGVGLLVRLNPKPGWGIGGAFNWIEADLSNPDPNATSDDFARLRTRPLMGGVSYNVARGPMLTSFSIVAGPSFNSARFDERFARSSVAAIDANTSFAVRPGIGVTYTLRPRVALVGFGGYLINRPGIVYRDSAGVEFRDQWHADAIVLSIGAVYSIF